MYFEFTEEQKTLQQEVRNFIAGAITPELLEETEKYGDSYGEPEGRKIIRQMAAKGWLTPTWPKEYGGLEESETANYMIREEMAYLGLPFFFGNSSSQKIKAGLAI